MPRKTAARVDVARGTIPGFNEAAARCRGKPATPRACLALARAASMRPRPDAAENGRKWEDSDTAALLQ